MVQRIKDFREFIKCLKEIGDIQEINKEVDWNLEMAAITRRVNELGAPAPLFQNIKGIERGFRALGAPGGISSLPGKYFGRIALSLGLPPEATGVQIVEELIAARSRELIPPKIVKEAPCKEYRESGDKIDLLKFPSPFIHVGDGGRYIGTYATIVARTPDGSWTNWSNARVMLVDKNRMTGIVHPLQHLGMIYGMWKKLGKDMPFAICLGVEPGISMVSGMPVASGVDEAAYLGGYFGEPIEVIKCDTVPLEVPASSEIVVEGYLSAEETIEEGPMGEYAGYLFHNPGKLRPVYHVTAVTYRSDPIMPFVVAGEPIEEDHTVQGVTSSAEALAVLRDAGIPATMVWAPLETAQHWLIVTLPSNWKKLTNLSRANLIQRIGDIILNFKYGAIIPKIIVLDDDIDATNFNEVVWAYATRVRPVSGVHYFENQPVGPQVVFLNNNEKVIYHTTKVVYDGLTLDDWNENPPTRLGFKHNYPQKLQEYIVNNWNNYGYK